MPGSGTGQYRQYIQDVIVQRALGIGLAGDWGAPACVPPSGNCCAVHYSGGTGIPPPSGPSPDVYGGKKNGGKGIRRVIGWSVQRSTIPVFAASGPVCVTNPLDCIAVTSGPPSGPGVGDCCRAAGQTLPNQLFLTPTRGLGGPCPCFDDAPSISLDFELPAWDHSVFGRWVGYGSFCQCWYGFVFQHHNGCVSGPVSGPVACLDYTLNVVNLTPCGCPDLRLLPFDALVGCACSPASFFFTTSATTFSWGSFFPDCADFSNLGFTVTA